MTKLEMINQILEQNKIFIGYIEKGIISEGNASVRVYDKDESIGFRRFKETCFKDGKFRINDFYRGNDNFCSSGLFRFYKYELKDLFDTNQRRLEHYSKRLNK